MDRVNRQVKEIIKEESVLVEEERFKIIILKHSASCTVEQVADASPMFKCMKSNVKDLPDISYKVFFTLLKLS